MSVFRTLRSIQNNHLLLLQIHDAPLHKSLISPSIFTRTLNSSPQIDSGTGNTNSRSNKCLSSLFEQGLYKSGSEIKGKMENSELKGKLRKLEKKIRVLEGKPGSRGENKESKEFEPTRRLSEFFAHKKQDGEMKLKLNEEESPVRKEVNYLELSPYAENFIRHLHREGYLNQANFLRNGKLDFGYLDSDYGRSFLFHAADRFGRNHQEIAKWVSGSNLKPVALFGCPSLSRKSVFAAKKLRKFFKIEEQTVCSKCVLKDSCKHANQPVWGGSGIKSLSLSDVMRVIFLYALDKTHPDLAVPDEIKDFVAYLLKEIVKLSRTTSS